MKLYHFALFFAVIASGCMVAIQASMLKERQKAEIRQTEYDCLAFAADDMAEDLFDGMAEEVSLQEVSMTGEMFFQSLALCRNGVADVTTEAYWKEKITLVVCEKRGYYRWFYGRKEPWKFFAYEEDDPVASGVAIPSVVAILATDSYGSGTDTRGEIYVASGITETKYYVTEDEEHRSYHVPGCDRCNEDMVRFCYATPTECARNGAYPCEACMK